MSKVFRYGGVVASIVLIAFGVGAIYMGVDGRDRVQQRPRPRADRRHARLDASPGSSSTAAARRRRSRP